MKKTIDQIDVEGKFVLMRADFNVPLDERLQITDDRRIRASLETIRNICDRDGRLILMSHLGRPKGEPDARYSLQPVAQRLSEHLGQEVPLIGDYTADRKPDAIASLRKGRLVLLENLRFHLAETIKTSEAEKDPAVKIRKRQFARKLVDLADVYVNDAFGTAHRDNTSMLTVPLLMDDKPKVAGFLLAKELRFLGLALREPARPFVAILGGAKVSDKIDLIEGLLAKCDLLLIGGAMTFTFMLARGMEVGKSLSEPDKLEQARRLLAQAGEKLKLPADTVCAAELQEGTATQVCSGAIPPNMIGVDIGPQTAAGYADVLSTAKTILWNGPMGVFELKPFDAGTVAIAQAVAKATDGGATTIIGGGDSAAAIFGAGLEQRITHVSTGGGACLEFLEGKRFGTIDILDDA